MIKYILLIWFTVGYLKSSFAQTETLLVAPNTVNNEYAVTNNDHFIIRNTNASTDKLVLFLGGSFSIPSSYSLFCQYAASTGLDVISLSYPNDVATASLGGSSNPLIFDQYRQEICFGTSVSDVVSVDNLNSITTRTLELLNYLKTSFPEQNWDQYLIDSSTINWSKLILAGHSQGSGHACYLAKNFSVDRVLMFSGPNDYSTFFNAPANWLEQAGITPITNHFALLHFQDEIVPFAYQYANLESLGLLENDTATLVDQLSSPYDNSNFLYINTPAASFHNATVGSNVILPDIWNYMLHTTITLDNSDIQNSAEKCRIFPNPVTDILQFNVPKHIKIKAINLSTAEGKMLQIFPSETNSIDCSHLNTGIYFLQINNDFLKFIKE